MSRTTQSLAGQTEPSNEIDLRTLGAALKRRRRAFILPTVLAFVAIAIFVNVVSPWYTAESQVLLENQENFFTRPDRVSAPPEQNLQVDQEGVASQVQLINSPDIARRVIKDLKLSSNPEFDPLVQMNPLSRLLVLLGISHDPTSDTVETRVTEAFLKKLAVFSPPKTRVITIQFTSKDPELAAKIANMVAELYIEEQSSAKRAIAKEAADALGSQIDELRTKLADADADRERYRLQTGLLAGNGNLTISGQQLADINSDLSKARSQQADSQAKASMIRDLLKAGKAADVPDVTNNDIVRRIWDQRSLAQAQLARESRTLLPGHPRIKELTAQVAEYDSTLKSAAKQAATSLENEAKIAGQRVANLEAVLNQQKKVAGTANGDEVHLRALERIAQSYKDQLESSTTKYQEALARQSSTATPADARIISRASQPEEPSFPKKIPFIAFGTIATLFFSVGFIIAGELLSGAAVEGDREPAPLRSDAPARSLWEAAERKSADTAQNAKERDTERDVVSRSAFVDTPAEPPRRHKLLQKLLPTTADETDPVFAPVDEKPSSVRGFKSILSTSRFGSAFAYLKGFGRSAAASRPEVTSDVQSQADDIAFTPAGIGWDSEPPSAVPLATKTDAAAERAAGGSETLLQRIVAAHVPGHGVHVVGTGMDGVSEAAATIIDLGRKLVEKGRAIIIDLNRGPTALAALSDVNEDGRARIMAMNGLAELLADDCSFAEVIHRDEASRLHFIPAGRQDADFRDFDLILDALSETYDFILLLTPGFPQSEIAKIMAPYADFVVLTGGRTLSSDAIGALRSELTEAGAREVMVVDAVKPRVLAQNVA